MTATQPSPPQSFRARRAELLTGFGKLRHSATGTMPGFAAMHRSAMEEGALTTATKELIALAIGICSNCDGCIAFHVHDALKAGASRVEIEETIGVAIMMGGGLAAVYGADAMVALDQFEAELE